MIGWIIAAVGLALVHKAQASGTPTPGTQVTVGPVPAFGNVTSQSSLAPSREPSHLPFEKWQGGPFVPIPTGSRPDILPPNAGSISDSVNNQLVKLGEFISGAADVRNPQTQPTTAAAGGAAAGGGGTAAPSSTVPSGGGTGFVRGGFSGGGLRPNLA